MGVDFGDHRQTGTEDTELCIAILKKNSYWYTLNDFGEVASRVFRWKDTELRPCGGGDALNTSVKYSPRQNISLDACRLSNP